MADIVNLRQARKQKTRLEKEHEASRNRALHGRTKAEKARDRLVADKTERFVTGHRREQSSAANIPGIIGREANQPVSDQSDGPV
jgi:hypothetical protein